MGSASITNYINCDTKSPQHLVYMRGTSWNDLLHQGQTADVSIIRAKTGSFSIETLDVHTAT
jgi:predicted amidohydrolase